MKDVNKKYKKTYPNLRHPMKLMRNTYINCKNKTTNNQIQENQSTIPKNYEVCNTSTIDQTINLNVLEGKMPKDINGNMYICQCLGTKEAFMVGDTNIVKLQLNKKPTLTNKFLYTPVSIAKMALQNSIHKFDHMGLMFMSPGLGMFSYTEGMYLTPDGRLAITSDVDRPWIIDRENLKIQTPLGKREQWLPMMNGDALDVMGNLFAGYSNSHVIYTDTETNELFLVNYQTEQKDKSHPCYLMKWDGTNEIKKYKVVDENNEDIQIKQSIHELIFTKDYILLADTAFVTGSEILSPWKNSPLPNQDTIMYIINRNELIDNQPVRAKKTIIKEACIHLIAEYDNTNQIVVYMLHTNATNTAEIIRSYDKDLDNKKFKPNMIGYGTLPVLDISSIGKHTINVENQEVSSSYLRDEKFTFGPYMYTYMGRQTRKFQTQDLYIMCKGFKKDVLPQRIYNAYKDSKNRIVPLDKLLQINNNNSISRIDKENLTLKDLYIFEDKVLLYTISCIESKDDEGYILAAVVRETEENNYTSGHEYWIFDSKKLSQGPICKLGHKSLNNSVLFHTLYLTNEQEQQQNEKQITYNVNIEEDYEEEELEKYNKEVLETFQNIIYPYFNNENVDKILNDLTKNRINEEIGKEHLIAEEPIEDPIELANRMFEETKRMLKTTGWKTEQNKELIIQSKAIKGIYEISNVKVTRAQQTLNINANKLFEYITSKEGYALIDPVSNPNDHQKPLEIYKWKKDCRLEAAIATTNIKMLDPCDFVVLNAIDSTEMIFASKSIIHNKMPGASKYLTSEIPENKHTRALNTFSIKIEAINENKCKVLCVNYADMSGKTNAKMNNLVNTKIFFQGLYKRIEEKSKTL